MPMPERMHPECPPDAHKVIRPPENELHAKVCISVEDSELENGAGALCDTLSMFAKEPCVLCSEKVRAAIMEKAAEFEIKPCFLVKKDDGTASVSYPDGAVGPSKKLIALPFADPGYKDLMTVFDTECYLAVDTLSMYFVRSLSTVYVWDKLLCQTFLSQYQKWAPAVSEEDKVLLYDVRYGRKEPLTQESPEKNAYQFQRLERKLFLQYPTED